jgi:antitoxin (DNA-binding transcriptional repressor) of toxin-antitoxin stability system
MKSVHVAELKNRLSAYLRVPRSGEEIVIRDRNLPTANLMPFSIGKQPLPPLNETAHWRVSAC